MSIAQSKKEDALQKEGNLKRILKLLLAGPIARALTLFILRLSRALVSVFSYARTYALFPKAHADDVYIDWSASVGYPERIQFGRHVRVGPGAVLGGFGGITIGENVRLSRGARLETGGLDFTAPLPYPHISKPIRIDDDVWVGTHAVILGGVTVGRGAIIGAQAVVTKDVPSHSIVVGNPAKVARTNTPKVSA